MTRLLTLILLSAAATAIAIESSGGRHCVWGL